MSTLHWLARTHVEIGGAAHRLPLVQAFGLRSDGQAFYANESVFPETPQHWQKATEKALRRLDDYAGLAAPLTDNAYGNSVEESQRGLRVRRGDKLPQKANRPYPKGGGR